MNERDDSTVFRSSAGQSPPERPIGETMAAVIRSGFWRDAAATAAFEALARLVFGLDFTEYRARGLWSNAYHPFAAFAPDGRCVASLCVFPSEFRVERRTMTGCQLLTVATDPAWRGRGLQRRLWAEAGPWCREHGDFTFLFTDDETVPFYEKLGLLGRPEKAAVVELTPGPSSPPRRFDLDAPGGFAEAERRVRRREPVSDVLGFLNPNLQLFMIIAPYRKQLYRASDTDALLIVEDLGDRVLLHDVIAERMPPWSAIVDDLRGFGRPSVELGFSPDRLGVCPDTLRPIVGSAAVVDGRGNLPPAVPFPRSVRA
jgi:GNAT superfamily N-acetyltransferase